MFYDRLNYLCQLKGIGITNAIEKIGMGSGNLSSWKSGNVPKGDTLSKLADFFGVSTDYLLCRTDDPSPASSDIQEDELSLLTNYRRLNPEGQEKLTDYAEDLVSSGRYIKTHPAELGEKNA